MIICGIKLTHDGALALIDNGKLIFSYEMEKIDNGERQSVFRLTIREVEEILATHGYSLQEIDQIVIDGWDKPTIDILLDDKTEVKVKVAGYGHFVEKEEDILAAESFTIAEYGLPYKSYKHVSSHVIGAYCTSPFARDKEDCFCLVWDGGMPPQLFYYTYGENSWSNLGPLFLFGGFMYVDFAHAFEPFSRTETSLSLAGKVMAYIALGKTDEEVLRKYREIFAQLNGMVESDTVNIEILRIMNAAFIEQAVEFCSLHHIPHENMLTTFHVFLQELLVENLARAIKNYPMCAKNLCFAGGSALNIKWNSAIREGGIFRDVWVPPFPNDSGSAIGTACCEMILHEDCRSLQWDVYSGPPVKNFRQEEKGYDVCPCEIKELAYLLYKYKKPVVFLNGLAELGPRSLGNRSILSPAGEPTMKAVLNKIKGREYYRPVAPICLEEDAPKIFDPGSPDPYMLYEHTVRRDWKDKVPAICHLDGSARLQTVNRTENAPVYELLTAYRDLSGIPLLCNTSANFHGKGFFPDVESVMQWGNVDFIWNDGRLFYKTGSFDAKELLRMSFAEVK